MTPKEKAEILVALMYDVDFWDDEDQTTMEHHHAKKCALIAVDEILKSQPYDIYTIKQCDNMNKYWQEVKNEIEKL
jgi:hypothetical protein